MIVESGLGQKVLQIFEFFKVDRTLPKFAKSKKYSDPFVGQGTDPDSNSDDVDNSDIGGPWIVQSNSRNNVNGQVNGWKVSFRRKIVNVIEKALGLRTRPKNEIRYGHASPIEFFTLVRKSLNEAQAYADRVTKYGDMIQHAKSLGQTAMVEKLMKAKNTIENESILFAANFGRFLTEKDVIEFALKCKKGLRLDWMENFCRAIPKDIAEKKVEADQLKIFDNYVILHYDPTGQSFATTQAEEEAKKDPILFGVIEGVRKLYFIGDWKDEECDLTLDEVESILGRSNALKDDPTAD
jgi:hypothetical protein